MDTTKQLPHYLGLMLLSALLSNNINSQVTIGSERKSREGALLDLTQDSITTKGLGIPRVVLKEVNQLTMGDHVILNENTAWADHTGLLVYNVNQCLGKGGEGLYTWSGSQWQRMPDRNIYDDALFQPNSYMVIPGTATVRIPVEKVFRIWEYYGSAKGNNRLPTESISAPLSVSLYWQDALIIPSSASISISGSTPTDMITVNLAGGTTKGNAVVALKDSKGTIRWSWHIWVTDDPTTANLNGNGFVWMDRQLGAVSATLGDVGTIGLTYQWGRKDPFPMGTEWGWKGGEEPTLRGEGEVTVVNKSLNNKDKTAQDNFRNSISHPIAFITAQASDWYLPPTSTTEDPWNGRWDRTENGCFHKSPLDPCPKGWRVPTYKHDSNGYKYDSRGWIRTDTSPWYGLTVKNGTRMDKRGWIWDDFGVYPFSGIRDSSSTGVGSIENTGYGTYSYMSKTWSASAAITHPSVSSNSKKYGGHYFFLIGGSNHGVYYPQPISKGYGHSVRCVKE